MASRFTAVLMALLLAACASTSPDASSSASPDAAMPPPSAHRAELSTLSSSGLVDIPQAQAYLDGVMQRLLAQSGTSGIPSTRTPIHVAISGSADIHANARPDGHIYVHWGALQTLPSEDALAALLAHETAHILLAHADLDARTAWIGPLANLGTLLASGTPLGAAGLMIGGQYADRALISGWSREQELQADQLGLQLLTQAGWPPTAFIDLLESLDQYSVAATGPSPFKSVRPKGAYTDYTLDLFDLHFGSGELSHPAYEVRRAALREPIRQALQDLPKRAASTSSEDGLQRLRQQPQVAAALQGLTAAHTATARATPPAQAAALMRQALSSPVADSHIVRISALATLPPSEWPAWHLPTLPELSRAVDAPIMASASWLAAAAQRQDWPAAVRVGDQIRSRYDYPPELYPLLITSYEHRARQIAQTLQHPPAPLSFSDQFALLGEQTRMHGIGLKLRGACMSTARSLGKALQCE